MDQAAQKTEQPKKRAVFIDPARMGLAEYQRQDWVANAPEGVVPDDLKEPAFWALMSQQMKPYDRVEVRADDGTWLAEVLVKQAERNYATVQVLAVHKLDASAPKEIDKDFDIQFKGPQNKWCVLRVSDSEFIKKNLGTREEALAWVADYRKAL